MQRLLRYPSASVDLSCLLVDSMSLLSYSKVIACSKMATPSKNSSSSRRLGWLASLPSRVTPRQRGASGLHASVGPGLLVASPLANVDAAVAPERRWSLDPTIGASEVSQGGRARIGEIASTRPGHSGTAMLLFVAMTAITSSTVSCSDLSTV